jgi:hypothetical protein
MWLIPDTFEAFPLHRSTIPAPMIANADEKKRLFAIELAKSNQPFEAALICCGQNTQEALWISKNWINDPQVLGHKDGYLNSLETSKTLLDKEEVAAKLLTMAEEKTANSLFYVLEGKDRLKALELYAKIQGYLDTKDKATNNFVHNQMIVKFVKPETKEKKIIDNDSNEVIENNITPLKVKLIGTG